MAQHDTPLDREWAALESVLDEELSRLPMEFRAPLVLCCLNRMRPAEAARKLALAAGSIAPRLHLAREALRNRLALRGLSFSMETLDRLLSQKAVAVVVPPKLVDSTVEMAVISVTRPDTGRTDGRCQ